MKHRRIIAPEVLAGLMGIFLAGGLEARAAETNIEHQLRELQEQNDALQNQLRQQQGLIDSLSRQVSEIKQSSTTQATQATAAAQAPKSSEAESAFSEEPTAAPSMYSHLGLGKVRLSGEGAFAFFKSESEGTWPNGTFRIDEARLFVDAAVWKDVSAFAEVDLITREQNQASVQPGEIYLSAENLSQLWKKDDQLNLRVGQFYIPYGEEYQTRYAIDDPLITHSVSDLWGLDEGVELYGSFGKFGYVVAAQNGGDNMLQDFTSDKSVSGRLSYDPARWLHLSVSAMRTGDLSAKNDKISAMWFGGGWFRSIGSTNTTTFQANLVEGDIQCHFKHTALQAFGGYIHYDDNDPTANNERDVYYYCVEGVQDIIGKLYGAARFSQIFARNGFPIVGQGAMGSYFVGPLTDQLWRLSLGLGYRFDRRLIVKIEYAFEQGTEVSGEVRDHENLFATQAAFAF